MLFASCNVVIGVGLVCLGMPMQFCGGNVCSAFAVCFDGDGVGILVGLRAIIQSPVRVHFRPFMIVSPLYLTVASYFVKVISHPALHRVTAERRECAARPGMMYPCRAAVGSCGMSSRHLLVDFTLFPSGKVTLIWSPSGSMVVACAFVIRKLLVAPESRIAH